MFQKPLQWTGSPGWNVARKTGDHARLYTQVLPGRTKKTGRRLDDDAPDKVKQ
jgi:hypothetical protein